MDESTFNRFQEYYDLSPLIFASLDCEGAVVDINPSGARCLGYLAEEIIGQPVTKIIHSEDKQAASELLADCLNNPGEVYSGEFRKITKDTDTVWVRCNARAVNKSDGSLVVPIVCEDITELKLDENLLGLEKNVLEMVTRGFPVKNILETICREIEAQYSGMLCSFLLLDRDSNLLSQVAAPSLPEKYRSALEGLEIGPGAACIGSAAYRKKQVIVSDIENDSLWEGYKHLALAHNLKACWSNPILTADNECLGTFDIYYGDIRSPGSFETKLIETATNLARIALENSRSREVLLNVSDELNNKVVELSKKNRNEQIINIITRSVHSSLDLQRIMENAVETMRANIDGADNVSIYLVEGDKAVIQAYRGYPDWFINIVRTIPAPRGFTWKCISEGKLIYCADVDKDQSIGPAGRKVGTKSYASLPLKYENETIGCINVNSYTKNAFDETDLNLYEIISRQIEIAINNARQAEALRTSEEKYRILYNQSPIGAFTFDRDLKIVTSNERHSQITDTPSERIRGLDLKTLEDQTFLDVYERALRGETCSKEGYYKFTHSGERAWLSVSASPLMDVNGKITGGIAMIEDITERKQTEVELSNSKEKYMNLINTVDGIVWEADPDTYAFTFVSPQAERILGFPLEEWTNNKNFWVEHMHVSDKDWVPEYCIKSVKERKDHQMEYRMVAADGRTVWIKEHVSVIEKDGRVEGLRGIMIDVSDHVKMEEELQKARNLDSLGILAGGIAHDFNNLLTAILGNITLIRTNAEKENFNEILKRLAEAEKASVRAKELTAQLLTFSRGGAPVKSYLGSIADLIRDTSSFTLSGSNSKCVFRIDDNLWPAEADEGQISQVIHNIVINADQAMPEGGEVTVTAKNVNLDSNTAQRKGNGKFIKISIIDNGIGMTEETKSKAFDPYFTTKKMGSGLGLSTAYSIIKNHDGFIEVTSEIAKGTQFDIYLPAARAPMHADPDYEALVAGEGIILVMDDEEAVREVACDILRHLGYSADQASCGEEAIAKYITARNNGSPYDAVLIDLTIPGGMGGEEANKKLLEIDPKAKTIVSSGYNNDPIMSRYDEYGFKGVITKPYKIDDLSRIINSIVSIKD